MGRLFPCTACKRHFFLSERVCPHCGESSTDAGGTDNRLALVLAMVASVGAAACSEPPVAVYGPAPVNPDQRTTTSTGGEPATPSALPTEAPSPTGPVASADPAPSSAPSATPSTAPSGVAQQPSGTIVPPATPTGPPKPTAVALYAAMPRDPNRRVPDSK